MSSIQERLQLKRVPLDTWNIREQLCLASAVVRSGDQNWMSVSRALKTVGEPNRPSDWYSQKSCAAQYGALLEHVETPKRKKRSSEGAVETPQESIVKRLTQERIAEIQKKLAEMNQQYEQMKNEIAEARNPTTSEERLREIWSNIESSKRAKERETARRTAWLKEREERRSRADRSFRPPSTPTSPAPTTPSSPLLTSLLKSSPVVTTPQHITHPANVVDTMSPSVTAPTLSMLLEKSSPQHESKHAAIEHIKSQLVQIEHQLKANTPTSSAPTPSIPAVDLDDIEIKEEDVYVFRDIDIHIPQVGNIPKSGNRLNEKQPKIQEENVQIDVVNDTQEESEKEEQITVEEVLEDTHMEIETEATEEVLTEVKHEQKEIEEIKLSFPEVKFPTTEIKVIHPDEQKIKEDVKEVEVAYEEPQEVVEEVIPHDEVIPHTETVAEEICVQEPEPQTTQEEEVVTSETTEYRAASPKPETIMSPVQQEEVIEQKEIESVPQESIPQTITEEMIKEEPQIKEETVETEPEPVDVELTVTEVTLTDDKLSSEKLSTTSDVKKDEDSEDSMPLKQMIREENLRDERDDKTEDTHTETDDDTPMELSREEEKDGKKKRDYSRKKKPDSRTCSGSESAAEASAPESPSATDAERQHRLWKKSVMLVYSRLCAHKYASLFLRPISDEEAPGYSVVVRRPMDLTSIRRNIENGAVRTTAEFQRDVLLMLSNALMYNSSEHSVYTMAKELHEEAATQLGMLLAAQAHAGLCAPPPRRKRRRLDDKLNHTR